jgi:hypothetical protein
MLEVMDCYVEHSVEIPLQRVQSVDNAKHR